MFSISFYGNEYGAYYIFQFEVCVDILYQFVVYLSQCNYVAQWHLFYTT